MADFFETTGGRSMELFCHSPLDGVGRSLGLPPLLPLARAALSPALVRSEIL